ncbi:MAG TPA: GIY-YIG nuclease family protein [Terriglobia bacterium]|nr:GIY-YIG nuclease family protein [Terriglobia bacterium]
MDRKDLIRQYKESRRPMGVYQIRNTANGKVLIGASVEIPGVLNSHKTRLRFGMHENSALQNDWNAIGPDAFEFEVLDTLTPPAESDYDPSEDLKVLEAMWLEKLTPYDARGYNARPGKSR